jgi:ligand-binding sensor domain-containing protein
MGGICSRSSAPEHQQQLLAICSSDSRQVPQYSRGIAEGIGDVWVQRRRGLWRWKMACHHRLGSISETRRHAGVGYQQGALAIRATCASHKYSLCCVQAAARMELSQGYCTMSGLGCLGFRGR